MTPQTEAITAALAYIEVHLCEPISLEDIANAAGYSLFHFIRTFNKIVRHTPYDYLVRRRLSYAAEMLLVEDEKVLDIALTCQFESHEGFTRAFGRLFKMPPTTWREYQHRDQRSMMPPLKEADLFFRQLPDLHPPELIMMDKLTLAGWMDFGLPDEGGESSMKDFLTETLTNYPIPGGRESLWEVRLLATPSFQKVMRFLGVQVADPSKTPDRFVIKTIRKGEFLRFSHHDLPKYRNEALNFLYHTFMPKTGFQLGEPLEIKFHGDPPAVFLPVKKAAE